MFKKIQIFLVLILSLILITGCSYFHKNSSPLDQNMISTAAMQTVQAVMTENAFLTQVAKSTQITSNPTLGNDSSSEIATLTSTSTPFVVVFTETPTFVPTLTPAIIDKASYIKDISIEDGTSFSGNDEFKKIWRLKNDGNTTWNSDYDVVFVSGNAMSGMAAYSLTGSVKPGETIDISIDLKAPEKDGEYNGNWMLRNSKGVIFGLGSKGDQPFWVKIKVTNYKSDDVPTEKYPYDFSAKICDAKWESSMDHVRTPCDTNYNSTDAYVSILMQPEFETKYKDDERTIKMHLSGKKGVWLQGFYKPYIVQEGDYIKTMVGCLENSKNCDVVVSLDIKVDGGAVQNIGKWIEVYDGKVSSVDFKLENYIGKNVEFILGISNRSDTTSDIFWLAPRIVR